MLPLCGRVAVAIERARERERLPPPRGEHLPYSARPILSTARPQRILSSRLSDAFSYLYRPPSAPALLTPARALGGARCPLPAARGALPAALCPLPAARCQLPAAAATTPMLLGQPPSYSATLHATRLAARRSTRAAARTGRRVQAAAAPLCRRAAESGAVAAAATAADRSLRCPMHAARAAAVHRLLLRAAVPPEPHAAATAGWPPLAGSAARRPLSNIAH